MDPKEFGLKSFLITAAVLVLLAIPTLARAHAGNTDPNVVHACVNNANKSVRIVGVSGTCATNESPAHWAIQGPKGDPGTNGTNGTNGTSGTNVTITGTFTTATGGCPQGGVTLLDGASATTYYLCDGAKGDKGDKGDPGTAATRAAGPCFTNNAVRYVDCGNGTVTDTVTGLIWLKKADCLGSSSWASANNAAAALKAGECGLTDGSSAGDWRLPTKDEWTATIARAAALNCKGGAAPSLTNDAGTGCYKDGGSSFEGVAPSPYWSSTSYHLNLGTAWYAHHYSGDTFTGDKSSSGPAWPVRSVFR